MKTCFILNEDFIEIATQINSNLDKEVSINTDRGPYIPFLKDIDIFWSELQSLPVAIYTKNPIQSAVEATKEEMEVEKYL